MATRLIFKTNIGDTSKVIESQPMNIGNFYFDANSDKLYIDKDNDRHTPINAYKADQLISARNLKVSLSTTSAAAFDGTADVTTIGVSGILPVTNGGTGVSSIADIKAGKDADGNTITSTYATKDELATAQSGIGNTITALDFAEPTDNGNSITFIDTITQENGQIAATKATVYDASASQSGIVSTGTQTFGGDKKFNGNIVAGTNNHFILNSNSYGTTLPANGIEGQLFFIVI